VHYSTETLDVLRQKFRFRGLCSEKTLPLQRGKLIQWPRPTVMSANTTPSAEGVVGTSLALSTTTVSATVQEFSDFISGSTLLVETDILNSEEYHSKELGYRAGLSVDTLGRIEFDSNTSALVATQGPTATIQDVRAQKAILEANLVDGFDGGDFRVCAHPYVLYDIKSDNTAGGFIDVSKYAQPDKLLDGEEGRIAGATFVSSTNVGTSGSAPNVKYNMYVVGNGAVGHVSLSGRGPSMVVDPNNMNFRVSVIRLGQPSGFDPEGKIGFVASYRFVDTFKTLDTTTLRFRIVQCDASLV
jgi:N4-gp56 family major capsid protein